jgi:GDP-mannose pyrophosphatase NudK
MKIISKEKVFDKFFIVQELKYKVTEEGKTITRYYVDKITGAAILIYKKDEDKVVLIKQFRVPLVDKEESVLLEVPAGLTDEGESAEATIIREVMEETGYEINKVNKIFSFYTSPGFNSERLDLFWGVVNAEDKKAKGGGLDHESENITVLEIPADRCLQMLDNGEIVDAKTIIALQWLKMNIESLRRK